MKKTKEEDKANIPLNKDVYDYIKSQKDYGKLVVLPEGAEPLAYQKYRRNTPSFSYGDISGRSQ